MALQLSVSVSSFQSVRINNWKVYTDQPACPRKTSVLKHTSPSEPNTLKHSQTSLTHGLLLTSGWHLLNKQRKGRAAAGGWGGQVSFNYCYTCVHMVWYLQTHYEHQHLSLESNRPVAYFKICSLLPIFGHVYCICRKCYMQRYKSKLYPLPEHAYTLSAAGLLTLHVLFYKHSCICSK